MKGVVVGFVSRGGRRGRVVDGGGGGWRGRVVDGGG